MEEDHDYGSNLTAERREAVAHLTGLCESRRMGRAHGQGVRRR